MRNKLFSYCFILMVFVCSCVLAETQENSYGFIEPEYQLSVGKTITPKLFTKGIKGKITYKYNSSDESVATVSKTGVVKGISEGTTKITVDATVKDESVFSSETTVNVVVPIKRIAIAEKKLAMAPETEWALTVNVLPEEASNKKLIWQSSDEKVATVSDEGVITAVAKGSCKITATSTDGSKSKAYINLSVRNFDFVITTSSGATASYKTGNGIFAIGYEAKNGCVEVSSGSETNTVKMRPKKAGSDKVVISVTNYMTHQTKTTSYSVFVAPSAVPTPTVKK